MTFSKAGEKILIIDHTGVPDELGGMGVGKALVEYMVHDVRTRGLKVIPLCPFTNATLRKHPEWQDILAGHPQRPVLTAGITGACRSRARPS